MSQRYRKRDSHDALSADARLDRQHLLESNLKAITQLMKELKAAGQANPVGFIADGNDYHGRQFGICLLRAKGMTDVEAERRVDEHIALHRAKGMIPVFQTAMSWEAAEEASSLTRPPLLGKAWQLARPNGHRGVTSWSLLQRAGIPMPGLH
jgi:hypothetical protein